MVDDTVNIDCLDTALLATVLSYLKWNEVLNARCVCRRWIEAATVTPVAELSVNKDAVARDLEWISRLIPNTQSFKIDESIRAGDAQVVVTLVIAGPPVDPSHLSNFTGLKHLVLRCTSMNGRSPTRYLFSFQKLQTLDLLWTSLQWDLAMLSGLPSLQKLCCEQNDNLTGDLYSIRVLKETLIELDIYGCRNVTGSLEDLYDFPLLEEIHVRDTNVVGEIRTIRDNDLISLKKVNYGKGVYGGGELKSIDEAPVVMHAPCVLQKRRPALTQHGCWRLEVGSSQRYTINGPHPSRIPPFDVQLVKAGSRVGWRWTNGATGGSCETHWLDPEPMPSDDDYGTYQEEVKSVERDVDFYRGFLKPPTEEEYQELAASIPLDDKAYADLAV